MRCIIKVMQTFPLAILPLPNIVLFPHTNIPMLISEPSYTKMIKDCIETDSNIGISLAEPIDELTGRIRYSPRSIGTMGRPILLNENSDGSIKVLIRGEKRIELISAKQNIPHLIYKCRIIPDQKESYKLGFDSPQITRLKSLLNKWVDDTISDSLERETFFQSLSSIHHITDYLAMFLVRDQSIRQILLENISLHERIQILSSLLRGDYPHCEDSIVVNAMKDYEQEEYDQFFIH